MNCVGRVMWWLLDVGQCVEEPVGIACVCIADYTANLT